MAIAISVFVGYNLVSTVIRKQQVAKNIKTIPNFKYKNTNGGFFEKANLSPNKKTVFLYFNTTCEFCQEETKQIKANLEKFKNVQLVFVSFEKPEIITKFAQNNQLNNYDFIYFLSDEQLDFSKTFDVSGLPTLVLYDQNQQLIEKLKGQIKTEQLLKKLNSN